MKRKKITYFNIRLLEQRSITTVSIHVISLTQVLLDDSSGNNLMGRIEIWNQDIKEARETCSQNLNSMFFP